MVEEATEMTVHWPEVLSGLVQGNDLSREMAYHVVSAMLAGQATDAQIAGFLIGLAAKGETTDEILGMRDAMFAISTPLELPAGTVDIVGVGGAPRRQVAAFNVSTIASFVASAAGATVCKHGNRKASSTSGSFDLLEALGVNIEASPDVVGGGVAKIGLGFAFARAHHPSMRHVGPARAQLGVPSVFNVLGPLAHPGRLKRQVLGVSDAGRAGQIADVVAGTDAELVWVVHGHDDLDELSLTGPAQVIEVRDGAQRSFALDPTELGFSIVEPTAIKGGDAAVNKVLAEKVFAGERSANRDMVVLNAGAGLVVAGLVDDIAQGVELAASAIDNGGAATKLDDLIRHTNL
jgi:anthranilate phosphoribosyltransferase